MASGPSVTQEYREHFLPSNELAARWVELLKGIHSKSNQEEREREFLFVHGWLRGVADTGMLRAAHVPELRELAFKAVNHK